MSRQVNSKTIEIIPEHRKILKGTSFYEANKTLTQNAKKYITNKFIIDLFYL